jgi:hypothetical protein
MFLLVYIYIYIKNEAWAPCSHNACHHLESPPPPSSTFHASCAIMGREVGPARKRPRPPSTQRPRLVLDPIDQVTESRQVAAPPQGPFFKRARPYHYGAPPRLTPASSASARARDLQLDFQQNPPAPVGLIRCRLGEQRRPRAPAWRSKGPPPSLLGAPHVPRRRAP